MRILCLIFWICLSNMTLAAEAPKPKQVIWPFEGYFGTFDRQAAQRGFQVYKEACAACHSLSRISYRSLAEIGFSDAEVKEIAKQYTVLDGPNDEGDMFERAAIPSDHFAPPFKNEAAARAANGGAYPPDLSLIVKARLDGANYVYSILTGYEDPPEGFTMMDGLYYNKYFPGHQIAMPSPLTDQLVDYQDRTSSTVDQMSLDVVNFLQWAAEPEMEKRKSLGLKVVLYLTIFTALFYWGMKRVWSRLK